MTYDELLKFCIREGHARYENLGRPFSRGGYTWASNGHLMVRVPEIDGVPDNPEAPDVEAVWAKTDPPVEWLPVQECEMPPDVECEKCEGSGKCSCMSCGADHPCGDCNGIGTVEVWSKRIEVGNSSYNARYLAIIQGWEIAPNGLKKAAWIRNGDAMGLLMPMRDK